MKTISFRVGNKEDDNSIVALLNSNFRTKLSCADWLWYCYENPNGFNRVYIMLDAENIAVGCYCVSPLAILNYGKSNIIGYANHLVIQPTSRDAFSFIKFSKFVFEKEKERETRFLIGPPNKSSHQPHKVLAGWVDYGYLDSLVKIPISSKKHSCVIIDQFTIEHEIVFKACATNLSFCIEKSAAWLNWRYLSRPNNPYTSFAFYEDGSVCGFIVMKRWIESNDYRKAHIMDLWANNNNTVVELLKAAEHYAADFNEINLWCSSDSPIRSQLNVAGYVLQTEDRQPLIGRSLNGDIVRYPKKEWSFMYGDGDTY